MYNVHINHHWFQNGLWTRISATKRAKTNNFVLLQINSRARLCQVCWPHVADLLVSHIHVVDDPNPLSMHIGMNNLCKLFVNSTISVLSLLIPAYSVVY